MRMIATVLALVLMMSAGAGASPHWPAKAVIRVWIDGQNAPAGGGALVEKALRTWTTAGEGRLRLTRTLVEADADIRVLFVLGGDNYGETRPRIDPATGFIDRAVVAIAAEIPVDPLTKQIVAYLTALHELGHALGLAHTTNFSDIMYSFREPEDAPRYFGNYRALLHAAGDIGSRTATGLSAYDVQALRALYEEK